MQPWLASAKRRTTISMHYISTVHTFLLKLSAPSAAVHFWNQNRHNHNKPSAKETTYLPTASKLTVPIFFFAPKSTNIAIPTHIHCLRSLRTSELETNIRHGFICRAVSNHMASESCSPSPLARKSRSIWTPTRLGSPSA